MGGDVGFVDDVGGGEVEAGEVEGEEALFVFGGEFDAEAARAAGTAAAAAVAEVVADLDGVFGVFEEATEVELVEAGAGKVFGLLGEVRGVEAGADGGFIEEEAFSKIFNKIGDLNLC